MRAQVLTQKSVIPVKQACVAVFTITEGIRGIVLC